MHDTFLSSKNTTKSPGSWSIHVANTASAKRRLVDIKEVAYVSRSFVSRWLGNRIYSNGLTEMEIVGN